MPRRVFWIVLFSMVVLVPSLASTQTFDESFDLWPVDLKLNGTVVAGGGLQLPAKAQELFVRAAAEEDANPVIVMIGRSKQDRAACPTFDTLDTATRIDLLDGLYSSIPHKSLVKIQASKAVWFHATSSFEHLSRMARDQMIEEAKDIVSNGGRVFFNQPFVESLGRLDLDSVDDVGLISLKASNLVPDAVIQASYVDDSRRGVLLGVLATHPRCVGVGIPSDSAIVLQGRKIRVLGDGAVTFCLMANEQFPLRIQHVKQAEGRRASPYETIVDLTAWRRDAIERTVEPFPSKAPPIPFVANGTLLIVGGGGMPRGLMEKMVKLAGGKDAKMVYVPCSEADEVSAQQGMLRVWEEMGVKSATMIHTKNRVQANSDEAFLAPLKDATGIWFGGGRQWNFADSYYGTRAHELMKGVLARGGVIGGSSAGASIQGRYLCRANPVANFDIMAPGYERGLGFLSGVAIDQHFSQRGRQKDMTQLVDRYPQLLGIGLDEATAIIVEKSRAEVVGRGKVFFYDRKQPVIPGTDDFLALGKGSVFDLEKRAVIKPPVSEPR